MGITGTRAPRSPRSVDFHTTFWRFQQASSEIPESRHNYDEFQQGVFGNQGFPDKRLRTPEPKSISEKTPNSSDCFQNLNSHRSSRWLQGSSIKKVNLYSILLHQPLFCEGNLPKSVKFRTYLLKDSLGKALGIHRNFSKKSTWRYLRVAKELDAHILRF